MNFNIVQSRQQCADLISTALKYVFTTHTTVNKHSPPYPLLLARLYSQYSTSFCVAITTRHAEVEEQPPVKTQANIGVPVSEREALDLSQLACENHNLKAVLKGNLASWNLSHLQSVAIQCSGCYLYSISSIFKAVFGAKPREILQRRGKSRR